MPLGIYLEVSLLVISPHKLEDNSFLSLWKDTVLKYRPTLGLVDATKAPTLDPLRLAQW